MSLRLITRADDAGMSRSANRAIRETCEKGICRNVSVLAPSPYLADAAACLCDLPEVCFGLHVDLNAEWEVPRWGPVLSTAQVPDLVDQDGGFFRTPAQLHEKKASLTQMMAEVKAQLQCLRNAGFAIRYLDEHMGVGWVNGLGEELAALARQEGLVYLPGLQRLPDPTGVTGLDHPARLAHQLATCPDGDFLVIAHPTYDDEEMAQIHGAGMAKGTVGRDRNLQRLMYLREDVLEQVRRHAVRPTRYDELV